jgi:hypothetical protein
MGTDTSTNRELNSPDVRIHYLSTQAAVTNIVFALFTGGLLAVLSMALAIAAGLSFKWVIVSMLVAGAAGANAMWFFLVHLWVRIRSQLEMFTGVDINNDGVVGKPETSMWMLDVKPDTLRPTQKRINIPGTEDQFYAFLRGGGLSGQTAEGVWMGPGRVYGLEFRELRANLMDRDLAVWKNPDHHAAGWSWTPTGERFCQKFIEQYELEYGKQTRYTQ